MNHSAELRIEGNDDALRADIRSRQYLAFAAHLPITVPAVLGCALAAAWAFMGDVGPLAVLLPLFIVVCIETYTVWHVYRRQLSRMQVSAADVRFVAIRSAVLGICLMAPLAMWFQRASSDAQIVIVAVVAAMIGLGGFVLSSIAAAGYGWTVSTIIVACMALQVTGKPVFQILTALLLVYGAVLVAIIAFASRNFANRARAEASAERQHELVNLLLKDFEGSARDWLWDTDHQGHLRHVSPRLVEAFGQSRIALEGLSLVQLLRDSFRKDGREISEEHDFLQLRLASRKAFRDQVVPLVVDGKLRWWSLTAKPLFDRLGVHRGWRGVGSDVTDAQRRELEMIQLANFDSLTSLPNRHQFQGYLDATLKDAENSSITALFVIDIDNFKVVNDSLGHVVGDQLLALIAQRLSECVEEKQMLCRLGGDEYALIAPDATDEHACLRQGQRLMEAVREPFLVNENRIEIRCSIGVAHAPAHGSTAEQLLKSADTALYSSKDAGRGRLSMFDSEMDARSRQRVIVQTDLANALANKELVLHYQPQIDTRTMRVVGFEALMRWYRDGRSFIAPSEFIPIAEESGLIVPIGKWALETACKAARALPPDLFVAVNLSAVQFISRSLVDLVDQAVANAGIAPSQLELEITETSLIEDSVHARETLRALRSRGYSIALDDFGTGYSSLAYLRSFPIDRLKIDGAFTSGLVDDTTGDASAIIRAIIQLASALKLRATAEGVETKGQLDLLMAKGCYEAQGFYFAHPMAEQEIVPFLEAWNSEYSTRFENQAMVG